MMTIFNYLVFPLFNIAVRLQVKARTFFTWNRRKREIVKRDQDKREDAKMQVVAKEIINRYEVELGKVRKQFTRCT